MSSLKQSWCRQPDIIHSSTYRTNALIINENEFIICNDMCFLDNKRIIIFKFNHKQQAWNEIMIGNGVKYNNITKPQDQSTTMFHATAFNQNLQMLYLIDTQCKLWHVDLNEKIISNCTNLDKSGDLHWSKHIEIINNNNLHIIEPNTEKETINSFILNPSTNEIQYTTAVKTGIVIYI